MEQESESYKKICEEIAKGNMEFYKQYLADDVRWNIIGNEPITGKDEIIERAGMPELDAYPITAIKNIIGEGEIVMIESTGEATLKNGAPYNQTYCDVIILKTEKLSSLLLTLILL